MKRTVPIVDVFFCVWWPANVNDCSEKINGRVTETKNAEKKEKAKEQKNLHIFEIMNVLFVDFFGVLQLF